MIYDLTYKYLFRSLMHLWLRSYEVIQKTTCNSQYHSAFHQVNFPSITLLQSLVYTSSSIIMQYISLLSIQQQQYQYYHHHCEYKMAYTHHHKYMRLSYFTYYICQDIYIIQHIQKLNFVDNKFITMNCRLKLCCHTSLLGKRFSYY